jgi:hypothetical protein
MLSVVCYLRYYDIYIAFQKFFLFSSSGDWMSLYWQIFIIFILILLATVGCKPRTLRILGQYANHWTMGWPMDDCCLYHTFTHGLLAGLLNAVFFRGFSTMMMEATYSSENSADFHRTTLCYTAENRALQIYVTAVRICLLWTHTPSIMSDCQRLRKGCAAWKEFLGAETDVML